MCKLEKVVVTPKKLISFDNNRDSLIKYYHSSDDYQVSIILFSNLRDCRSSQLKTISIDVISICLCRLTHVSLIWLIIRINYNRSLYFSVFYNVETTANIFTENHVLWDCLLFRLQRLINLKMINTKLCSFYLNFIIIIWNIYYRLI